MKTPFSQFTVVKYLYIWPRGSVADIGMVDVSNWQAGAGAS